MPRPSHDLPHLLVGAIKDYAAEQGISPEEAHIELLRVGLSEKGVLPTDDVKDNGDDTPD